MQHANAATAPRRLHPLRDPMNAGLCQVPHQDAMWSARRPRPAAMRQGAACGLGLKQARYHARRSSDCVPAAAMQPQILGSQQQATRRPSAVCRTAARDAPAPADEAHVASNGAHAPSSHKHLGTASVHGGERAGRPSVRDTITTPIVQNSTYWFRNTAELIEYNEGRYQSYEYGRYGNPTVQVAEDKIKELEGAEDCLISASGMNAVTSMLLSLVPAGGHIVTTSDCYWRTRQFMQTFLPKMNIGVSVIKPNDLVALQQALDAHNVSLFFSESPTNPYLRCVDIPAIAKLCKAKGAIVCVDSTFATPINSRALALGAFVDYNCDRRQWHASNSVPVAATQQHMASAAHTCSSQHALQQHGAQPSQMLPSLCELLNSNC